MRRIGSTSRRTAILSVRGQRVEFTLGQKLTGELVWNGKLGKPTKPVRAGMYVLRASAQDRAGNLSKPYVFAIVQVRYVDARAEARRRRTRSAFLPARLDRRADRAAGSCTAAPASPRAGTLRLRAPKTPGVYHLYVTAAGHSATATVVVA